MNKEKLKNFLDSQYLQFNAQEYLMIHPDPLSIVHQNKDFVYLDELAFICAMYAYGNASLIVKNLSQMPFNLLLDSKQIITSPLELFPYYRFQTRQDTKTCFLAMSYLIENGGIKRIFLESFQQTQDILQSIYAIISLLHDFVLQYHKKSHGIQFLFGNPNATLSPLKRFNMFLRWMVRKDNLDLGIWSEIPTSSLLLPLDTHTFRISKLLGICVTKSYTIKAVQEITKNLKEFDSNDPVKYDFALYRIGQLKQPLL